MQTINKMFEDAYYTSQTSSLNNAISNNQTKQHMIRLGYGITDHNFKKSQFIVQQNLSTRITLQCCLIP